MPNQQPGNDNKRHQVHPWQLVLCDLDGTMLDQFNEISPENLAAVAALREHRIGFSLATGRMDAMTRLYVRQLRVTLPIIACNGAVIRDCTTNELLGQTCIPADDVIALTDWLKRKDLDFLVYTPDSVYYLPESRRIDVMHQYNRQAKAAGQSLVPLHELNTRTQARIAPGAVKILALIPDAAAMADLQAQLANHPGSAAVMSMDHAIDIMAAGVTKGNAMLQLARMIGVQPDQIVTLGDHDNDASMLRLSGLGIAMGNATPLAVAASRLQTLSHDQSGVADAIRRYVLPN